MKNKADLLDKIDRKENLSEDIAEEIINNPQMLPIILDMVSWDITRVKLRSAKILTIISRKYPEILYPHMGFFIDLLDNDNRIILWIAMDVIANLSALDSENKFNDIFEKFYSHIYDESMVLAAHVVDNSWKIVKAKPIYQNEITDKLMRLEKIPRDQECRNILLDKAILSFDKYFDHVEDKEGVISLVKRQLNNSRNATKKKAEKFLKKHST